MRLRPATASSTLLVLVMASVLCSSATADQKVPEPVPQQTVEAITTMLSRFDASCSYALEQYQVSDPGALSDAADSALSELRSLSRPEAGAVHSAAWVESRVNAILTIARESEPVDGMRLVVRRVSRVRSTPTVRTELSVNSDDWVRKSLAFDMRYDASNNVVICSPHPSSIAVLGMNVVWGSIRLDRQYLDACNRLAWSRVTLPAEATRTRLQIGPAAPDDARTVIDISAIGSPLPLQTWMGVPGATGHLAVYRYDHVDGPRSPKWLSSVILITFEQDIVTRIEVRRLSDVTFHAGESEPQLRVPPDVQIIDKRGDRWVQHQMVSAGETVENILDPSTPIRALLDPSIQSVDQDSELRQTSSPEAGKAPRPWGLIALVLVATLGTAIAIRTARRGAR